MDRRHVFIFVTLLLVFIAIEAATVQGEGEGEGNKGEGNGNGNKGEGNNGNGNGNNGNNGNGNGNNSNGGNGNNGNNGNGNGNNGNGNGNGGNGNNGNGNDNGNGGNGNGNDNGNGGNGNNGNGNGNGNGGKGNGNGNGNEGNGNGNGNGNEGNGNGNGNEGNGNGNEGNGNGNEGNGNGNGNEGNGNGNGNGNGGNGNGNDNGNNGNTHPPASPPDQSAISDSERLPPVPGTGQEQAICRSIGACNGKILTCPSQCTERKPSLDKEKGCFIDCSSKCEATCRSRRPSCDGLGSVCYDPRFVGGDGIMFYFHGQKGSDFALVSDKNLQINAHFIGTRPAGRTRDFTWVQAIAIMFDSHTLVIAAKKVSHWDSNVDALALKWDGKSISIPTEGDTEWRTNSEGREVLVERTDATNTLRVTVSRLIEVDVKVTPIGQLENKVHNYQLPSDDAFAHLETQIRYLNVSDSAEGILGKTYRSDYVSPVKRGVAMPTMNGEDKYQTPSLYSPSCKLCMFQRPSGIAII